MSQYYKTTVKKIAKVVTLNLYKCDYCGHEWNPRKGLSMCPHCKREITNAQDY